MDEGILYECVDTVYPDYRIKVAGMVVGGHLTVFFKDQSIHEQDVPLAYDAIFGPDMFDIEVWGQIACEIVDKHRVALDSQDPGIHQ